MPLTRIEPAAIADTRGVNFRNIIINGDMSVAQRRTSSTGITSGGYETIDRIKTEIGTQGTWTQSQSTDVPSGQGFSNSFKMDCTVADASPAAADRIMIRQFIEGQNLQYLKKGTLSAESLTLSFWVKSNKTGTYIAELYDGDNTRQISKSYTIDTADTWEKKTITYAGDTTGTFDNDNATSLALTFFLGVGSEWTSGTLNTSWNSVTKANRAVGQVNLADTVGNEWYITGLQLEAGTSASDFEFSPHDVNFHRCLRYYQHSFNEGTAYDTTTDVGKFRFTGEGNIANRRYFLKFSSPMRTTPTVTFTQTTVDGGGSASTDSMLGAQSMVITGSSSGRALTTHYKCEAEL